MVLLFLQVHLLRVAWPLRLPCTTYRCHNGLTRTLAALLPSLQRFLDDIMHQLRTNPDFKGILSG